MLKIFSIHLTYQNDGDVVLLEAPSQALGHLHPTHKNPSYSKHPNIYFKKKKENNEQTDLGNTFKQELQKIFLLTLDQ